MGNGFKVHNCRNRYHLIPYIGNKSGFAHIFDELAPPLSSRRVYDLFGGSGAFSIWACHKFGSKRVTYNDNNPVIVNFINCIQNEPKKVHCLFEMHRKRSNETYYFEVRDRPLDDGVDGAGRFLYLAKNAFSGKIRFNSSNKFNAPMRKGSSCPRMDLDRMMKISAAIKEMTITNCDFEEYGSVKNAFLYLDPPYLENTNGHYNGVPDVGRFVKFVKAAGRRNNLIMISESNSEHLELSDSFTVYSILLMRSLQYVTCNSSDEIIAVNYAPKKVAMREPLVVPPVS